MIVVRTVADYRKIYPGGSIGFVPTMGALHEGHLSLIRESKGENQTTVLSVFVNPTQFGPNEDLTKYPRPFEKDVELAIQEGVDILFAPQPEEMYPEDPTSVHVPGVSEYFDGVSRPGHFDGVATVVAKLFNIIRPTHAYFGQKDLQQCAVVRKLIDDLNFDIQLKICQICRENSGLAMSSRNEYLSTTEKLVAPVLYSTLLGGKRRLLDGEPFGSVQQSALAELKESGFEPEYFELVNRFRMSPISVIDDNSSLIVAAKLGATRLIDNLTVTG
ncbi:MAG TPA: pantoate--beta-alanine ligase [Fimbriimonas sp.]|nr:pantoate--beta-alanine ligase [Fimbriimonas sp.]